MQDYDVTISIKKQARAESCLEAANQALAAQTNPSRNFGAKVPTTHNSAEIADPVDDTKIVITVVSRAWGQHTAHQAREH